MWIRNWQFMVSGAIGVTLGGGIGMLMGLHGLMIDSLKSVQLNLPLRVKL
jgi:hypothetical protein